ncbi:hypothetical protein [Sandaracinus amylolyticus]|uniref:hypothetical protein n=1 Tax=Sandaracinus amylolyticus TaxID=927083 RepID=UPI001F2AD5B4|nr:hypothetical protein [Sandaracinus amylolyticus]
MLQVDRVDRERGERRRHHVLAPERALVAGVLHRDAVLGAAHLAIVDLLEAVGPERDRARRDDDAGRDLGAPAA